MKFSDVINGTLVMIAGIAIFLEARTFPAVPGQRFGASFFPSVVGGVLAFAGLALALSAVLRGEYKPYATAPEWIQSRKKLFSFILIILSVLFYIFAVEYIGFIVTIILIVFGLQVWLGAGKVRSMLVAIGSSLVFYMIFSVLLRVPLQSGIVERFIF
jgi:putative tricarboxylic transport membrane protein